jgi:hypothetical protein
MTLKIVPFPLPASEALCNALEAILEEARSGQIEGLVVVEFHVGNTFATKLLGSVDNIRTVASLATALHDVIETGKLEFVPDGATH